MPHPTPGAERSPSVGALAPAASRRGLLARVAYVLRGDKYMVDAYPAAPPRDER